LLADPGSLKASEAREPDAAALFGRSLRTYRQLWMMFRDAGCALEDPIVLGSDSPPRWSSRGALSRIEAHFAEDVSDSPAEDSSNEICVATVSDRRNEIEFAVAQVCAWVARAENPLRYRDIALICRDLEPYHDLLSAALAERGIPYFLDRRRTLAHHPLVELVRGALSVPPAVPVWSRCVFCSRPICWA
jgi:ATP-dependent helicase/nuclease subunit B